MVGRPDPPGGAKNELALISRARVALEKAKTICETAEIRDQAAAMSRYLKRKAGAAEAARHANEIRLRAERKIGKMLRGKVQHQGGTVASNDSRVPPEITRDQSSKYQRMAELPTRTFERELKEPEPTTAGMVRKANEWRREKRKGERYDDAGFVEAGELKGRFRVIYADPPWQYGKSGVVEHGHADTHYPTMSVEELCSLPIQRHALPDSVLFLWTTAAQLVAALEVLIAWGFKYKAQFVWDKVQHVMGHYNSVRHELLLIGTRGACTPDVRKLYDSVQSIPRGKHSEKPEEFREIIDTLYSEGARVELFARKEVHGWTSWGNEA